MEEKWKERTDQFDAINGINEFNTKIRMREGWRKVCAVWIHFIVLKFIETFQDSLHRTDANCREMEEEMEQHIFNMRSSDRPWMHRSTEIKHFLVNVQFRVFVARYYLAVLFIAVTATGIWCTQRCAADERKEQLNFLLNFRMAHDGGLPVHGQRPYSQHFLMQEINMPTTEDPFTGGKKFYL